MRDGRAIALDQNSFGQSGFGSCWVRIFDRNLFSAYFEYFTERDRFPAVVDFDILYLFQRSSGKSLWRYSTRVEL
jgi:hypothetical protein